jgi:2-aminoadipate transaminase
MFNADALFSNRAKSTGQSFLREIFYFARKPGVISFAGGLPNAKFFPVEPVIAATEKAMRADGAVALQYATTEGHDGLREWIAARYQAQGLAVTADMIMITSGSQQGLDLTGKSFINPGDTVLIEKPGYQGAIQAYSVYEPRWAGVRLTDEGLDLDELKRAVVEHPVKLMETCCSFQNPSGVAYSAANRAAMAEIIEPHNFVVVEDDPYVDLRFMGSSAPPLRHYMGERLITLGSFSKIVAPGLRLGWLVADPALMPRIKIMKQAADLHTSFFAQRVLYQYLIDNDLEAHIDTMRALYKSNRDVMVAAIDRCFPPGVKRTNPEGGMFIWAVLPDELDAMELFKLAVEEQVAFVPGTTFYTDGSGRNTLRMSYSNVTHAQINEGIERLGRAMTRLLDAPSPA